MGYVANFFKHVKLVSKHKWLVFKFSCKVGIPWRGFMHDWSKFSIDEFWESVKYYDGHRSPISVSREQNGYSIAWLHHKGRNKHHLEYWVDLSKTEAIPVFMPYKYIVEALCDKISAVMAYNGKNFKPDEPYKYWIDVDKDGPFEKHPATVEFFDTVLGKMAEDGVNSVLNSGYLKQVYSDLEKKYKVRG